MASRAGNGNFQTQSSLEPSSRALREIQPDGAEHPLSEGSVLGLTGEALANLVKDAAIAADLGDGFSGHSGRIGMARRVVAAGALIAAVQHQGRWHHSDTWWLGTPGVSGRGGPQVAELTYTLQAPDSP